MAEHPAVNRRVVSSSLTCGARLDEGRRDLPWRPFHFARQCFEIFLIDLLWVGSISMDMKEFIEHERIRQALNQFKPITAVHYDPDIIGAIIGQAELLCRFIPNIDGGKMDGIYVTTGGVALKL